MNLNEVIKKALWEINENFFFTENIPADRIEVYKVEGKCGTLIGYLVTTSNNGAIDIILKLRSVPVQHPPTLTVPLADPEAFRKIAQVFTTELQCLSKPSKPSSKPSTNQNNPEKAAATA